MVWWWVMVVLGSWERLGAAAWKGGGEGGGLAIGEWWLPDLQKEGKIKKREGFHTPTGNIPASLSLSLSLSLPGLCESGICISFPIIRFVFALVIGKWVCRYIIRRCN
ncbi:hypothetical protein LOK49_LG12G00668 [Camellia lanceoleosa]|uniref:Uncharacterized protein n=1 Tax=Camellia lanceoleosa TaxID=1840588 RepID=A0ACC0FTZ9_9ERIC|nr:hypothetical protein LOK49_LG12G00668 [Camellia lanceoleosa]